MHNLKQYYTELAYNRAQIKADQWQPQLGFNANKDIMYKVYIYYQYMYLQAPSHFLWIGLARLTGGQVLWGMHRLCKIAKDPCVITQHITHIAKDIFEELAWQHEFFLEDKIQFIEYLKATNTEEKIIAIWQAIAFSNNSQEIENANMQLLHYEQFRTVQPHYNIIKQDAYSKKYVFLLRFVMRNIHPHHRRFIYDVPFGDVTNFAERWRWISHSKGMWPSWVSISEAERTRVVSLNNNEVIMHQW